MCSVRTVVVRQKRKGRVDSLLRGKKDTLMTIQQQKSLVCFCFSVITWLKSVLMASSHVERAKFQLLKGKSRLGRI